MPVPKSRELHLRMLENDFPTGAELAAFVRSADREDEGQWFDFKAGAMLANKKAASRTLREYASGFANADGGFLIVGYNEGTQLFDGALGPSGQPVDQWAANALGPLAAMIGVPRLRVVPAEGVDVLLVAVGRARGLVFCIEDGEPVYHVRFGHQTLPMPQWLVTDLMLGRRAQPDMHVTRVRVQGAEVVWRPESRSGTLRVSLLCVDFENDALTLAEMVRCGLVGRRFGVDDRNIPQQLRRSIDLNATMPDDHVSGGGRYPWGVQHLRSMPAASVGPFEPGQAIIERWNLPVFGRVALPVRAGEVLHPEAPAQAHGAIEAKAALYLIAKNTEPSWWQLTLRYDVEGARQLTERGDRHLRFEPCLSSRPVVSLRFLAENEPVEFQE